MWKFDFALEGRFRELAGRIKSSRLMLSEYSLLEFAASTVYPKTLHFAGISPAPKRKGRERPALSDHVRVAANRERPVRPFEISTPVRVWSCLPERLKSDPLRTHYRVFWRRWIGVRKLTNRPGPFVRLW